MAQDDIFWREPMYNLEKEIDLVKYPHGIWNLSSQPGVETTPLH